MSVMVSAVCAFAPIANMSSINPKSKSFFMALFFIKRSKDMDYFLVDDN
jgi:hypothetical protein